MQIQKITITITVEVLSIDAAPAILAEVGCAIDNETTAGQIQKADGDCATWTTAQTMPTAI